MPIIPIADLDDPRLAAYGDLPGGPRDEGALVLEGELCVRRAWDAGLGCEHVVTTPAALRRLPERLVQAVPTYVVEESLVQQLVGFAFHRGCLGLLRRARIGRPGLADIAPAAGDLRRMGLLFADRIADPVNIGGLVRTARGLGVDGLVLGRGCGDPWSRRAIRASMGHCFGLAILVDADLCEALEWLRGHVSGFTAVTTSVAEDAVSLREFRAPQRWGLVVGNEGQGVSAAVADICDASVKIPMATGVDSLNVVVATAIVLWSFGCGGARVGAE